MFLSDERQHFFRPLIGKYREQVIDLFRQARKEEQQDPGETGGDYADRVLQPLLRSAGRCCDQGYVF